MMTTWKRTIAAIIVAALAAFTIPAGATDSEPIAIHLGLENATLTRSTISESETKFALEYSHYGISLTDESARRGGKAVEFRLKPKETRTEIKIATIPNNTTRFVGFSVYFPEDFQPPKSWTLISQWWQGSPASPNIAFELDDTQNRKLAIRIVSRTGTSEKNRTKYHYVGDLEKNRWIDFLVMFRVDDTGGKDGLLYVWRNGEPIVEYKGELGYTDLYSSTSFRIGLYRSSGSDSDARVLFDDIYVLNLP